MKRYLEIKPGSISETIKRLSDDYQAIFKKELEKTGKGIGSMTPDEKKAFFNKIDKMHNAKSEAMNGQNKPDDSKTTMVVKPGAPAGQEKVIRIPKEKLADYKSKGYVEAESYIPEAKKIDELTAGQKKLPPALQKAIKAKEKKEEVEMNEITDEEEKNYGRQITSLSNDKVMARIDKKGDAAIAAIQAKIDSIRAERDKKRAQKNEEIEITEGQYKEIDIRKGDLKLAKDKKQALKDKYNAIMANQAQGDEDSIADQIQKLDMSIKKQEQELIDIMKKGKDSEKKEAVEGIEEAVGPNRITNLNDKISRLQLSISKLDKSKPESKTKEAILKSDLNTAKLRLTDIMKQNAAKAVNEAIKAKQSYKTLKMSLKKEQEVNNKKKTLTDKPITKIEVNPKIEG